MSRGPDAVLRRRREERAKLPRPTVCTEKAANYNALKTI